MNGPLITVFTPAFNRAHTIWRTYQSLCRQTCKDFIWMVIDDGSTDNTAELVLKWKENSEFEIIYIYQQNQGMHGAHNTAYQNITTELNVCIDSDDYMPEGAIELITNFWRNNGSEKYAGIIGLDVDLNQQIIGTEFPNNLKETTLTDFYANGGKGDKKLVYRTEVIKKYPKYPIFDNEKYVGLAYKYMLIDQDYTLLTINRPLVVVEYQQDGSSNNMLRQYWNNPKGFAFYRKTEMVLTPTLKRQFMSCIHYVSSSIISKNKNFIKESPKKLLSILSIIPGIGLYFYIKFKLKQ